MSTSSTWRRIRGGFTLVELVIGLSLAVLVCLAVAPLWLSMDRKGAGEADAAVSLVQARVAVARFERDLRLAGAGDSRFSTVGPVLQATSAQVVFLQDTAENAAPSIVEWEIAGGALMRRTGSCPVVRPSTFAHSLYADSKTMLDQVAAGSSFTYEMGGAEVGGPVAEADLEKVEAVILHIVTEPAGATAKVRTCSVACIGR